MRNGFDCEGFVVDLNDGVRAERLATVQEVRDRRTHVSREISRLLSDFEFETSLRVDALVVLRVGDTGEPLGVSVEVSL